jgi:hypothetical protein
MLLLGSAVAVENLFEPTTYAHSACVILMVCAEKAALKLTSAQFFLKCWRRAVLVDVPRLLRVWCEQTYGFREFQVLVQWDDADHKRRRFDGVSQRKAAQLGGVTKTLKPGTKLAGDEADNITAKGFRPGDTRTVATCNIRQTWLCKQGFLCLPDQPCCFELGATHYYRSTRSHSRRSCV